MMRPTEHSARRGKSLADMNVDTELAIHVHEIQEPPDADLPGGRSRMKRKTPRILAPSPLVDVVDHIAPPGYFSKLRHLPIDELLSQYNINLAKQVAIGSQLRLRFEQEAKLLKKFVAQVARRDQRIATREKHIKDLEAQLEAEINMKKVAEVKNSEAQEMGEKRIMAAFEDFKKHEDERVNSRCAEMDAQLDVLSVDFNEELYSHIIKASFCQCYVYGDSQGYERRVEIWREAWKAGLELTDVEAYDPEANNKFVAALHDLKDLNYPLIDELEQLKDAPLDVIMASLYLDSDTGEDVPQFIRASAQAFPAQDSHVSGVPTIAPQGLQILLVDAAT
ncbi:hypothetical protein Tco_0600277 [Tanacetum coccineum]|uniref:Uncharacterized protein n=1 Tax=Tanacetum coccineum TaxID=301880 RepID=A0ABQ4WBD1_9ASTR